MGERRRGLLRVQSEEGRSPDTPGAYVAGAHAVPADRARSASERAAVSAELSARKLDGLSLLGFRPRAVAVERRTRGFCHTPACNLPLMSWLRIFAGAVHLSSRLAKRPASPARA